MQFTKEAQELAKPCYEAIKKISKGKWEWEPERGEQAIYKKSTVERPLLIEDMWDDYQTESCSMGLIDTSELIPLLHWERIRKILRQFGYSFSITSGASGGKITVYENIGTDKVYEKHHNNDLQLEIM